MLPIHKAKITVFNYDQIPAGYYHKAMLTGSAVQKFWHRKKFQEIAARIGANDSVLDFGCGPGSFLSVLAETRPGVRAVGVDIASRQIEYARSEIASKYADGRIRFQTLESDLEALPFPDASFDVVTSIEVIEHIHPYYVMKMLLEAKRVLKPNGRLIVTTPNYRSLWPLIEIALEKLSPVKYHEQHINRYTPNALVKFLETVGLEVTRLDSIFILAPFTAALSPILAEQLHKLEKSSHVRLGSLLVAESKLGTLP